MGVVGYGNGANTRNLTMCHDLNTLLSNAEVPQSFALQGLGYSVVALLRALWCDSHI